MNTNTHKNWVKEIFDRAAASYGKKGCSYFDVFGKGLVSKTNLALGEQVLDIATGNGAILFPAAKAVSEKGLVVGIDISPEMIDACKQFDIPSWVELQVMDGENLNFPDNHFDAVFCGFAIFFFPNLTLALEEIRRVMKANGRLAISVWGRTSPLTQWIVENSKKYGASKQLKTVSINTPDALKNTLHVTGFKNINIYEETTSFWHESAEDWWDSLWSHALRSFLEQLSSTHLESLHQEALKFAEKISTQGRIQESMHAIYAIANKE